MAIDRFDENSNINMAYASVDVRNTKTENQNYTVFYDQEPFFDFTEQMLADPRGIPVHDNNDLAWPKYRRSLTNRNHTIIANSEISEAKDKLMSHFRFLDWYYFSHGFIALDWFRDIAYLPIDKSASFDKVFIMFNHLTSKYRSYRLGLVADIMNRGLLDKGYVSLPLEDKYHGSFMNEILDKDSLLSLEHKKLVVTTIKKLSDPLIIDDNQVDGSYSAKINLKENQRAFWHIITETNFYLPKLHLTEKVFKPIVSFRPFILACAPNNLKYLRSYGFKTFSDFIDESYDAETDNTKRMVMIVNEIERLCKLSPAQQRDMFEAMKPILEHNFNHFYGNFRKIIVDEMVYGFGEMIDGIIDDSRVDYAAVSRRLIL